jgi:hypothetical protein
MTKVAPLPIMKPNRLSAGYAASLLPDIIPCQTAGVALKKMLLETL